MRRLDRSFLSYSQPLFISKKAPGDRAFTQEEVRQTGALIEKRIGEEGISPLPPSSLKKIITLFRKRPVPPVLATVDQSSAEGIRPLVQRSLKRKEVAIKIVDLGKNTGFPRENARPACEVMFVEKKGKILWKGRKELVRGGGVPTIFITSAFYEYARSRPSLLLQAILHPLLEWLFDLPHMIAVLCESAYDEAPSGEDAVSVSDLNRYIAEDAARDRDFSYFDRILGTSYEPDELRMDELSEKFGTDEEKISYVAARSRSLGDEYRNLVEKLEKKTLHEIFDEEITKGESALTEGDIDRALTILRKLQLDTRLTGEKRDRVNTIIELAIRCYAMGADPSYEGLSLLKGSITRHDWIGENAVPLEDLLKSAIAIIEEEEKKSEGESSGIYGTDPLGKKGKERIIHVLTELDRPTAKFIDGHDRVHWVFNRKFLGHLIDLYGKERGKKAIPSIMVYRFVRDGVFPDEKLKIEQQYSVAVKGALAGYRFYQSISKGIRKDISRIYETADIEDPLYRLFISLGEESNVARASHMIKDALSKTYSFNYVRYPETPLAGKVIAITGGGTGMGRAIALEGAIRGANVVIMGRRPSPLDETRADMDDLISHLGLTNRTFHVQGDVSDPKYVGDMFESIRSEFGRLDILYNNAGVSGPVEFGTMYQEDHFEQYRDTVNIHLTGAWLASLEAGKLMESQHGKGLIVMVGTFYCESIHRHVLHAYPGRLPYTSAQSAKLALGDYLAWAFGEKGITVLSLNPSAVSTERIQKGSGVFDKGSLARARIGRAVAPETLERGTLDRTVTKDFVHPRDFARVSLDMHQDEFKRCVGGQRMPMGGVTYEQPPGVIPSPAKLDRYPDLAEKTALVTVHSLRGNDRVILEYTLRALSRSGARIVLAGDSGNLVKELSLHGKVDGGEIELTSREVNLAHMAEVQEFINGIPRIDLFIHFTGSVDWKLPLTKLSYDQWNFTVDRYGFVPRLLTWCVEKKMDRDGNEGTIIYVGPDLSAVPSIKERDLVQVFQAMMRPAVATESMERALMRKSHLAKSAPFPVSSVNFSLILPGKTDGRNKQPDGDRTAASVLWLAGEGKRVSGAVILPDEHNSIASLPEKSEEGPGILSGKAVVVTGGIRNLGKAISLRFGREKAAVVAASRYPKVSREGGEEDKSSLAAIGEGNAVLSRIRKMGGSAFWKDTDITSPGDIRGLMDEAARRFGSIDLFVNNAGAGGDFSLISDVMREHRESWDSVMKSNFMGPWYAISLLHGIMSRQKDGGSIVNISTHYADHPYLFRTIYTVSKITLKALTLSLHRSLAERNIQISDVAPSLIAGPRMDWVMGNYAKKFASHFGALEEIRKGKRKLLEEHFITSFNRALTASKRKAGADAFKAVVQKTRISAMVKKDILTWYDRMEEWFSSTVPATPPFNEDVAEAVAYGAKNSQFMETPFIGVSPLPPFTSFPPTQKGAEKRLAGNPYLLVTTGVPEGDREDILSPLKSILYKERCDVTILSESQFEPGRVTITRSSKQGPAKRGGKPESIPRSMDLTDPRIIEPWLDNSLFGKPPFAGAVLNFGLAGAPKDLVDYSPGEMEGLILHLGRILSLFGETLRGIREGGDVIVIVPSSTTGEGHIIRAAVRQMVRTALAEQHFLYPSKKVNISLRSAPDSQGIRHFYDRVRDILAGLLPAEVEEIAVGPRRP